MVLASVHCLSFSTEDVADSTTGSVPTSSPRTFNIGDLVWGPSRGFPSWPGKLVAESEVRGNHKLESGKVLSRSISTLGSVIYMHVEMQISCPFTSCFIILGHISALPVSFFPLD